MFLYILNRPRSFYFRIKVPLDLRPRIGRTFIVRSLGTRDLRQARYLASGLGLALYSSFEKMRLSERTPMVDINKLLQQMGEGRTRDFGADEMIISPDGQVSFKGLKVDGEADTANLNNFIQASLTAFRGQTATIQAAVPMPAPASQQSALSQKPYSEHVLRYLMEINPDTANEYQYSLELFQRIVGDKPLDKYDDDDMDRYTGTLLLMPAYYSTKKEFRNIDDIFLIIKKNETVKAKTFDRGNIQKKHVGVLKTFFNWAIRKKALLGPNPVEGHDVMSAKERKKGTGKSFMPADLREIFAIENYRQYCTQPADWFAPLIALFTSGRLNEISQMRLDDVVLRGDIPYFFLRGDLKTKTSERIIPIHSVILASGFLEYLEDVRSLGCDRVFPYLMYDENNGYGARVTERFSNYLKAIKVKKPEFSLHSFRYNFDDGLKQMGGFAEDQRAPLTGHSHDSVSETVYTSVTSLAEKKKRIEVLQYPDVNFAAIRYEKGQFLATLKRELRTMEKRIKAKESL